jgi:hypothetical protein
MGKNMDKIPRIAVQLLAYRHPGSLTPFEDLDECLTSLQEVDYPKEQWCLVIIDNPSTDGCFYEYIEKRWLGQSQKTLPKIFLIKSKINTGFAGGHILAQEQSKFWKADFLYLLNQDTICDPSVLKESIKTMNDQTNIATVQSCIMLKQNTSLLNSCGNCLHFLGFGFCDGYQKKPEQVVKHSLPHFYNSGAGLLVRVNILEEIGGLFDASYFMYHEDVDLAWRARLAGFDHAYAEKSIIYHHYEFSRSIKKFFLMERNRIFTHLTHLHLRTFIFIFPPFFLMEIGTFLFALRSGWGREKWKVWLYFFQWSTWKQVRYKRKQIKKIRKIKDRQILSFMVGRIESQEVENILLKYIINPFLNSYFWMLKKIIWW